MTDLARINISYSVTGQKKVEDAAKKVVAAMGFQEKAVDDFLKSLKGVKNPLLGFRDDVRDTIPELNKFGKGTKKATSPLSGLGNNARSASNQIDNLSFKLTTAQKVIGLFSTTLAGVGLAKATRSFTDYEDALLGVSKTTNIVGDELDKFGKRLRQTSIETGFANTELLNLAQIGGQLGVSGANNLEKFSTTVAKLGVASNLAGEEGATALARIANLTDLPISDVDKLASAIVATGNNFATTEREIGRSAQEIAKALAPFNATADDVVGLGTALSQFSIQAELGSSVLGKTFNTLDSLVRGTQSGLDRLAEQAGVTGDQFRTVFQNDNVAGFELFVKALSNVSKSGESVSAFLSEFKLKGDEINKVLPTLAQKNDLFVASLRESEKAFMANNALQAEYLTRSKSLSQEFARFRNAVNEVGITVGSELAPPLQDLTKTFRDIITSEPFTTLAKTVGQVLGGVVSLIDVGIKPLGLAIAGLFAGKVLSGIGKLGVAFGAVGLQAIGMGRSVNTSTSAILTRMPLATTAVNLTKRAFTGLWAVVRANPLGALLGLVGLASTLFKSNEERLNDLKDAHSGLKDKIDTHIGGLKDLQGEYINTDKLIAKFTKNQLQSERIANIALQQNLKDTLDSQKKALSDISIDNGSIVSQIFKPFSPEGFKETQSRNFARNEQFQIGKDLSKGVISGNDAIDRLNDLLSKNNNLADKNIIKSINAQKDRILLFKESQDRLKQSNDALKLIESGLDEIEKRPGIDKGLGTAEGFAPIKKFLTGGENNNKTSTAPSSPVSNTVTPENKALQAEIDRLQAQLKGSGSSAVQQIQQKTKAEEDFLKSLDDELMALQTNAGVQQSLTLGQRQQNKFQSVYNDLIAKGVKLNQQDADEIKKRTDRLVESNDNLAKNKFLTGFDRQIEDLNLQIKGEKAVTSEQKIQARFEKELLGLSRQGLTLNNAERDLLRDKITLLQDATHWAEVEAKFERERLDLLEEEKRKRQEIARIQSDQNQQGVDILGNVLNGFGQGGSKQGFGAIFDGFAGFASQFQQIGKDAQGKPVFNQETEVFAQTIKDTFGDVGFDVKKQLADIGQSFSGFGGQIVRTVGNFAKSSIDFFQPDSAKQAKFQSIGGTVGNIAGTALGSIGGPIGAAIGGALGDLAGSALGKLIAGTPRSRAVLRANDDDIFLESFKRKNGGASSDIADTIIKSTNDFIDSVGGSISSDFAAELKTKKGNLEVVFSKNGQVFVEKFGKDYEKATLAFITGTLEKFTTGINDAYAQIARDSEKVEEFIQRVNQRIQFTGEIDQAFAEITGNTDTLNFNNLLRQQSQRRNTAVNDFFFSPEELTKLEAVSVRERINLLKTFSKTSLNELEQLAVSTGDLSLKTEIYRAKIVSVFDEQISLAEGLVDKYKDVSVQIRGFIDDLFFTDVSPLTASDRLQRARDDFNQTSTRALSGDIDALNALTSVSDRFLDLSKQVNASSDPFQSDFSRVVSILEQAEGVSGNLGLGSDNQVSLLRDINQSIITGANTDLLQQQLIELQNLSTGLVGGSVVPIANAPLAQQNNDLILQLSTLINDLKTAQQQNNTQTTNTNEIQDEQLVIQNFQAELLQNIQSSLDDLNNNLELQNSAQVA